jgi:hypothetical protein
MPEMLKPTNNGRRVGKNVAYYRWKIFRRTHGFNEAGHSHLKQEGGLIAFLKDSRILNAKKQYYKCGSK